MTSIADIGVLARDLTWDGQLRWLGPEKGVMHMAIGAVVNAAVGPALPPRWPTPVARARHR